MVLVHAAPKRVALVIGNSAYEHSTPLINPRNDAIAISKVLKELGFHVITALDAKYRELPKALGEFEQKLRAAEVGLLYYSGHGLQIEGRNFLVPVDADINTEIDVQFQAVRLDRILNVMQSGPKVTLVFLDACRNNPLARRLARRLKTRSSIIGRGLARIRAKSGMLVAYATAPGDVAQDGTGKYSPFTTGMLAHIKTKGLDISPMLRRVRRDVMSQTSEEQVPWTNSSLTFDFVFNPAQEEQEKQEEASSKADTTAKADAATGATGSGTKSAEQYAWEATAKVGTCGAYEHFYTSYPHSFFAGLARSWTKDNCSKSAQQTDKKPAPQQFAIFPPIREEPVGKSFVKRGPDLKEVARELQKELKRVGCLNGRADGVWGAGSRRAAKEFNRVASRTISPDKPSLQAVDVVRSAKRATCNGQPESARYLAGVWSCRLKTQVFLTKPVFLFAKGKEVVTDKCRSTVVVSRFDGKYFWMKNTQKCRRKTFISFGASSPKTSVLKSKLWYKNGQLLGQAYEAPRRMIRPGWNPIARFELSKGVMKLRADGFVMEKGEKYRFKTRGRCVK